MINKPTIIITSLGRTGSKFFTALFNDILFDCRSLHEPDVIHARFDEGTGDFLRASRDKLWEVGWKYLFLQKSMGRFSLVKLSDSRLTGTLSAEIAVEKILEQRKDFVLNQPRSTYLESSFSFYGLVDLLPKVFTNHRAAYIIRDGRDWVQSFYNWGKIYGKSRIRRFVGHNWLTADNFLDDPYCGHWKDMSRFERLCWAWNRLNRYALKSVSLNPYARLFRFEELFLSSEKYDYLSEFVAFLTEVHGGSANLYLEGRLDKKIHESVKLLPDWPEWSDEEIGIFLKHCKKLMLELSYEI